MKSNPCLRNATIYFIPEANMGNDAQIVSENVIRLGNVRVLSNAENYYGVLTNLNKFEYFRRLHGKLGDHDVSFHENIVVANPFDMQSTEQQKRADAYEQFEQQMRGVRRYQRMNRTGNGRVRHDISARVGDDGQMRVSLRDDMVMAFMIGLYFSGQFRIDPSQFHVRGLGNMKRTINELT